MKKITMILLIGMLCLTGCSEGENLKDANESDSVSNTEEKDTKIKNEISDAIKKLQSKDFYAEGLTTEFSHITYIRKYDSEKDKVIFDDTGIQGVYGQAFITIDYKNKGKNQVVKYYDGTMSGMFKNDVLNPSNMLNAEGYSEEKITFDNVLKKVLDINNIEPKIFELKDQKYLYDNELVEIPLNGNFYEDRENYGQSVDWNFNAVYAFNFFNITNLMNETNSQNLAYFYKWTKPTFRMVPSYYFDVGEVIKNNDGGKKITLIYNETTSKYDEFLNSKMHSKMIDDESTVKVVCENEKLCFQDKVKEAKIEFTINADGELVQYRRYSNMYFEDFDVTLPYIVDYTFTVQN